MTSKEKLLKIRQDFYTNEKVKYVSKDYFTAIEKDLEVLEILKSHAKLTELNSVYIGYPKIMVIAIDSKDDDYEIVKRWLGNE